MPNLSDKTPLNDILIEVKDVGIHFQRTVTERRHKINNSLSSIFKFLLSHEKKERFWALRGIDFTLKRGEVVGVIGRNGAGKSTLLKILVQVLIPDKGTVKVNGRVSSLLALGSGFMPLLSGRENVYLNGMYMGMSRPEINDVYDDIVSFSGLEKFIETPIKYYSLGMRARLGFSVAVHTKPEILIVDEALGAGDKGFQEKAKIKMREFMQEAKAIIIVTHNLNYIKNFCTQCLWLNDGEVVETGEPSLLIDKYSTNAKSVHP